jgi:hypothetical protein
MDYRNGGFIFSIETYKPIIKAANINIKGCAQLLQRYKGTVYVKKDKYSESIAIDIDGYLKIRDLNDAINYNKNSKISPFEQSDYFIFPQFVDSLFEVRPDPKNIEILKENEIFIELSDFIDVLGSSQKLNYLSDENLIYEFLEIAAMGISKQFIENKYAFKELRHKIYIYFDQLGYLIFMSLLGQQVSFDIPNSDSIALEEEIQSEDMLDGRYWFDLNSIIERWESHNISRQSIFHFAETGRLEICFDWISSHIREYWFTFKKNPMFYNSVSPLVSLIRAPVDSIHFHIYEVDDESISRYNRLVALSDEDVKDFISRGNIHNPVCGVNGFMLEYFQSRDFSSNKYYRKELPPVILEENHLLITSREVRRFEKHVLKLNTSMRSKVNLINDKPLTPTIENNHLRVMGALLELLKNKRLQPYTLELIKSELTETYGENLGIIGFSKSNLDKLFSKANSALKDR